MVVVVMVVVVCVVAQLRRRRHVAHAAAAFGKGCKVRRAVVALAVVGRRLVARSRKRVWKSGMGGVEGMDE